MTTEFDPASYARDKGVHVRISTGDTSEEQSTKVTPPKDGDGSWGQRWPVPPEDEIPFRTWVSYVKKDGAWVKEETGE